MVSRGADVNCKNKFGITPLHQAAFNGCTRTCEKLLTLGAHIAATNCLDVTPMHMAVAGVAVCCSVLLYVLQCVTIVSV